MTNAVVNKVLNECIDELEKIGVPVSMYVSKEVKIKPRAINTLGQCARKGNTYEIAVAKRVVDAGIKVLENTIYHELLHTCPNCMNHGETWKRWASLVNRKLGLKISRCSDGKDLPPVVQPYKVACVNCNQVIGRSKRTKLITNPERYRCACGGKLVKM
jgi:predicted SprT family Zn-dependent metalloprotease